jgi:hypothetical protein
MKKKPAIKLTRGNIPKKKMVGRSSPCWRCGETMAKNDPVFEIPGETLRSNGGRYYKKNPTRYCQKCIKDSITRTEKELDALKKQVS